MLRKLVLIFFFSVPTLTFAARTSSVNTSSGTGGSGTPGGSNTQLQYNNNGVFSGSEFSQFLSSTSVGFDPFDIYQATSSVGPQRNDVVFYSSFSQTAKYQFVLFKIPTNEGGPYVSQPYVMIYASTYSVVGEIPNIATSPLPKIVLTPPGTGASEGIINLLVGANGINLTNSAIYLGRSDTQSINFQGYDCSTYTAGGALSVDSSNHVTCVNMASGGGLPLAPGDTNYIQNRNTLQNGATFYVSSGTVNGQFSVNSAPSSGVGNEFSQMVITPSGNTFGNTHTMSFRRYGSVNPANLNILSYGSDGTKYTGFQILSNQINFGDQTNSYLISGLGDGRGETAVISSGTSILNLPHRDTFGVYGSSLIGKPIFGAYSSDSSGNVVVRFQVDQSSVGIYLPIQDILGSQGTSGQVFTSRGTGQAPTWQIASGMSPGASYYVNVQTTTMQTGGFRISTGTVNFFNVLSSMTVIGGIRITGAANMAAITGTTIVASTAFSGPIGNSSANTGQFTTLAYGSPSSAAVTNGTYTPTASATANLDSTPTMQVAQYNQNGNVVVVSGRFTANPTLAATTTSFEISLPVGTGFDTDYRAGGTAFCGSIAGMGAEIYASVASTTNVLVIWKASDINSQSWSYIFQYLIQPAI